MIVSGVKGMIPQTLDIIIPLFVLPHNYQREKEKERGSVQFSSVTRSKKWKKDLEKVLLRTSKADSQRK